MVQVIEKGFRILGKTVEAKKILEYKTEIVEVEEKVDEAWREGCGS